MRRKDAKDAKQRLFIEPSRETEDVAFRTIGAAIEVHKHLGPGFVESVYERALCLELTARGIPFEQQTLTPVTYKGVIVSDFRVDLVIAGLLVVELKAIDAISSIHVAQLLSYLRATDLDLGLLINFNVPVLHQGIRRVIWSQ
jgi:GxxExxY protein